MKMHILNGGRLRLKSSIFFPDVDRQATIDVPVLCFLLRHPQGNVLFDTGCHPSVATNGEARWGGIARVMVPIGRPEENLLDELKCIGVEPDDIDVVVNSHFHSDHCGCNEFFKRATVICHAKELATARGVDADKKGYVPTDWDQPIPIDAIEGERDLFGDGRIVLLPMPGHTIGTITALTAFDRSGSFLLASDAVSIKANLDQDIVPRNTMHPDLFLKSFAEIRRLEADGTTVLCGHDAAQWATLRKGADAYD